MMPPKKRKTHGKKSKNESTGGNSSQANGPKDLHYSGFSAGLEVASSPGPEAALSVEVRCQDFLKISEEQLQLALASINSKFESLIGVFESNETLRTAVWEEGDWFEVAQSLIEKEAEMPSGSHESESKKLTWATPGEPTRSTRDGRRSKSVDPSARHTVNRGARLSATYSYPDLKTPMQLSHDRFRFNIATVTPHPNKTVGITTTTILRKPNLGETAISMSGSPLLVSSDHFSVPSVVVPLADGRVFNVLGNFSNVVREQLRSGLNSETVNKLRDLKEFMNQLVP